jgi:hypothetical protein
MILAKRSFKRLSVDIPWHSDILNKVEFDLRYKEMHKPHLIFENKNFSDPFIAKFITVWDSQESYDNYRTDEILCKFWKLRDQYNEENSITVESASVEEITSDEQFLNL